jgi:hypothetical protein
MTSPNYQYCIVGFGIAGQLLALELIHRKVNPSTICILDKNFLGGALSTQYATVISNTPWWKTRKALSEYPLWSTESIQEGDSLYSEHQCMPVRDISRLLLETANKATHSTEKITATVTEIQYNDTETLWTIQHSNGTVKSSTLFLAQGALEKQLQLDKPTIPLSIALDKHQLQNIVTQNDRVTVFGTSHSGTILLNHLHELNIPTFAVYNTETPFLFKRDGHYDGVKEKSEQIADAILRGEYTNCKLLKWSDPLDLYNALKKTTKVIYSIGFRADRIGTFTTHYDPLTAAIGEKPNCYGYGIAYPGTTVLNDTVYTDVSVLSFQEQIRRTIPVPLSN